MAQAGKPALVRSEMSPPIAGAALLHRKVYGDARGTFTELFNSSVPDYDGYSCEQVSVSESRAGVMRGMHRSKYDKLVSCTRGRVFDVVVDLRPGSDTFMRWSGAEIGEENGLQVLVPAGCAHGFLSLERSTISYMQRGVYCRDDDVEVNCLDKELGIVWPASPLPDGSYIMSDKDRAAPSLADVRARLGDAEPAPYLLMGVTGFVGSEVARVLDAAGVRFTTSGVRVDDMAAVRRVLDARRPTYVICAAGVAGKPNIDWCEDHQEETVMANVAGQLNVARACSERGVHCTLFGTGSLYAYDDEHAPGSGRGFGEADKPNFSGNFYVRCRILLETLLESFGGTVLNLRIVFPVSSSGHPRGVASRLVGYPRIVSVPTSFTVVDNLFPLIPQMCERRLTGTFNFTNPGVSTNSRILQLYRQHVDPSHTWEDVEPADQLAVTSARRAYSELDVAKLVAAFPDATILPVDDAIARVFERMGAEAKKQ